MSDKPFEENFWQRIERDGGFKLGEMVVISGKSNVGKSMFDHLFLLDTPPDDDLQSVTVTMQKSRIRDYNGEQLTFDFNANITDND